MPTLLTHTWRRTSVKLWETIRRVTKAWCFPSSQLNFSQSTARQKRNCLAAGPLVMGKSSRAQWRGKSNKLQIPNSAPQGGAVRSHWLHQEFSRCSTMLTIKSWIYPSERHKKFGTQHKMSWWQTAIFHFESEHLLKQKHLWRPPN